MSDSSEAIAGVGLFVAAYVDENGAKQGHEDLKQAKKDGAIDFDDAVIISCDDKGKVHSKETGDMTTGKGAGIGALIGGVIGLVGGPAGMAAGAGAGALIGGIASHGDAGFDNDSIKEIGGALIPGTSALLVTTSKDFVEQVRKQASGDTLTVAQDIASQLSDSLNAGQDILLALAITEDGVAATQVVSSGDEIAAFGIATDGVSVAATAVAADADGNVAAVDAVATPVDDDAA